MVDRNSLECPNCGKKTIVKPKVYYEVFKDKKQPDGVCECCGTFYWEHSHPVIPPLVFKVHKKKEERELSFDELLKREEKRWEKKREKRRRYRRNRRLRKAMKVEKSRI